MFPASQAGSGCPWLSLAVPAVTDYHWLSLAVPVSSNFLWMLPVFSSLSFDVINCTRQSLVSAVVQGFPQMSLAIIWFTCPSLAVVSKIVNNYLVVWNRSIIPKHTVGQGIYRLSTDSTAVPGCTQLFLAVSSGSQSSMAIHGFPKLPQLSSMYLSWSWLSLSRLSIVWVSKNVK